MKILFRSAPVVCLLAIGLWFVNSNHSTSDLSAIEKHEQFLASQPELDQSGLLEKDQAPMERMRQEFELTVDPALGRVPSERLLEARAIAANLQTNANGFAPTDPWVERGPDNVGGRTRGLMFDPNDQTNSRVFAGGVAGGIWVTQDITNPAMPWTKINDFQSNLAISQFAYDPNNTMTFYVGTGEGFFNADAVRGDGLFKSTDGGATWTHLLSTSAPAGPFSQVQDVAVTSTSAVLACTRQFGGTGGGVFRSTDGGATWTQVLAPNSPNRCSDLEIAADGTIYAAMGIFYTDGIYASTDDGATWTKNAAFPVAGFDRIELATAPSNANVVYAMTHTQTTQGVEAIRRSADAGASWTALSLPVDCDNITIPAGDFTRGQAWYDLIMEVNPTNENDIIVGGIDLFRTADADAGGGNTWDQMSTWDPFFTGGGAACPAGIPTTHADQHAIVYRPGSSTEAIFGHDGGVDYAPDVTALNFSASLFPAFVDRNNDYNVTQYYAGAIHPTAGSNVLLGGTQDNGTQRLNSAAIGTALEVIGGDGAFAHIDQTNPNIAYGSTQGVSVRRSTNGGLNFSTVFSQGGGGSFINPSDYDNVENIFYGNFTTTNLIRITNSEVGPPSAALASVAPAFNGTVTHLRVSEFSPGGTSTLYLGTSAGRIYRIADGSLAPPLATVELGNPGVGGSISSIDIGASENQLLVTYSNYGVTSVWQTLDGGTSWTDLEGNLPDMPVRWGIYHPVDKNRVVLATEAGVWESDDTTALSAAPTWTPTNVPLTRVDMLQWRTSDNEVLAATHGRGMWTSNFVNLPVELADFDATVDGSEVVLNWKTLSEENNAGFEIEQAFINTSSDGLNYEKLGYVEGQGSTNVEQNYSFRADQLNPGLYSFRLKQVDFDGRFEYSPAVQVEVELPTSLEMTASYPNPFSESAQFSLRVQDDDFVEVDLYDLQGRKVKNLFAGEVQAGYATPVQMTSAGLSNGSYFLRAKSSNTTTTERIEILK